MNAWLVIQGFALGCLTMARPLFFLVSADPARLYGAQALPTPRHLVAVFLSGGAAGALLALTLAGLRRGLAEFPALSGAASAVTSLLVLLWLGVALHAESRAVRRLRRRALLRKHRHLGLFAVVALAWIALGSMSLRQQGWHVVDGLLVLSLVAVSVRCVALWSGQRASAQGTPALAERPRITGGSTPMRRVVWVIFDELDARMLDRADGLGVRMPNYSRLRGESVEFTSVRPAAAYTELALPVLLTGQDLVASFPVSRTELHVTERGSPEMVDIRAFPSVFELARARGAECAVVGWYHPYCALFGTHLRTCVAFPPQHQWLATTRSVAGLARHYLRAVFETRTYSPFGQSLTVKAAVRTHDAFALAAFEAIANPSLSLVVLHWPLPHPPYFYDAKSSTMTGRNRGASGYLEQLQLLDQCLGELLASAPAGADAQPVFIVTSDHPWRSSASFDGRSEDRVPLLVHFPGQRSRVTCEHEFSARHIASLVLSVLSQQAQDPHAVVAVAHEQAQVHVVSVCPVSDVAHS